MVPSGPEKSGFRVEGIANINKSDFLVQIVILEVFLVFWGGFWVVLALFWGLFGQFWEPWGVTNELQNETMPYSTQLLEPKRARAGLQGRFSLDFGRFGVEF